MTNSQALKEARRRWGHLAHYVGVLCVHILDGFRISTTDSLQCARPGTARPWRKFIQTRTSRRLREKNNNDGVVARDVRHR